MPTSRCDPDGYLIDCTSRLAASRYTGLRIRLMPRQPTWPPAIGLTNQFNCDRFVLCLEQFRGSCDDRNGNLNPMTVAPERAPDITARSRSHSCGNGSPSITKRCSAGRLHALAGGTQRLGCAGSMAGHGLCRPHLMGMLVKGGGGVFHRKPICQTKWHLSVALDNPRTSPRISWGQRSHRVPRGEQLARPCSTVPRTTAPSWPPDSGVPGAARGAHVFPKIASAL